MAPDRHSMSEMHRSTVDSSGANVTAGYRPAADGSGNVVWSADSGGGVTVEEEDGSPSVAATKIEVPNGGMTDDGGGVASLFYEQSRNGGGDELSAHGNMGATETFAPASGNWHTGTLNAACTFTFTAPASGMGCTLFLELAQDSTGGWAMTLPASFANKAALEAAQVTTASTVAFLLAWTRDGGTTWYGGWIGTSGSVTFGTPAIVLGTAAASGSIAEAIRRDSTIIAFDATVPTTIAAGATAATGSAAIAARRDHTHGAPASFGGEVIMTSGVVPPDPVLNSAGDDWLYSS